MTQGLRVAGHGLLIHGLHGEHVFCEASQENSQNARARMLQAKGIKMPGSKEAIFYRGFPCVEFSPFGGERGLVYYCLLENCGASASTVVSAFACVD